MTQFLHGLFPYPLPCGIFAISEAGKGKNAEFPPGTGWFQSCRSRGNAPSAFFHVLEVFIPCLKPGSLALNHLQLWGFVFSRIHPLSLKAEMMQCEPSAEKWSSQDRPEEGDAQTKQLFAKKKKQTRIKSHKESFTKQSWV